MRFRAAVFFIGAALFAGVALANEAALPPRPEAAEIEALWNAGKKSQAERKLDRWMKQEKKSPWPWVQSAVLEYRQKKYKQSLARLKAALEKDPNCAEAYYWRGKNYEAQNKPMDAANEYRAALMAEAKFNEAQEALDRVLALLGSS